MPILLNAINRLGRPKSSGGSSPFQTVFLLGPPSNKAACLHRLMALHPQVVTPCLKELVFPGKGSAMMRSLMGLIPQAMFDRVSPPGRHHTGANEAEADDIALWAAFSEGLFAWAFEGGLRGDSRPIMEPLRHV
ncbi:MAG: hypothetical protein AAF804_19800, partial [Bacteroidota bacterium]